MKKVTMSTIKPAKVYTDEGKTYLAFYVGSYDVTDNRVL